MANKKSNKIYIEQRDEGDFAVRRAGAKRASAVEDTQEKAIERAREIDPNAKLMSSECDTRRRVIRTSGVKPKRDRVTVTSV